MFTGHTNVGSAEMVAAVGSLVALALSVSSVARIGLTTSKVDRSGLVGEGTAAAASVAWGRVSAVVSKETSLVEVLTLVGKPWSSDPAMLCAAESVIVLVSSCAASECTAALKASRNNKNNTWIAV